MNKGYASFLIFIFICNCTLKAQTFDTTTYSGKMGYIFTNVNTSGTLITTGLLRDYGVDFLNLDNYTGTSIHDSNFVSMDEWRFLYASLYSSQINTNANLLAIDYNTPLKSDHRAS